MSINLLVLDIDETQTPDRNVLDRAGGVMTDSQIAETAALKRRLNGLADEGNVLVHATNGTIEAYQEHADMLALPHFISCNASTKLYRCDRETGEITLDETHADAVRDSGFSAEVAYRLGEQIEELEVLGDEHQSDIKVSFQFKPGVDFERRTEIHQQLEAAAASQGLNGAVRYVEGADDYYIDFLPEICEKAHSTEWIRERVGAEPQDTYVFGNGTNDISMFQQGYNGVAVGNSAPELIEHVGQMAELGANHIVAEGHAAAGVMQGLEAHGLIHTPYNDFILAVTPTMNRQEHLERQYWTFSKEFEMAEIDGKPQLGWVIVDESAEASQFFTELDDDRVIYIHMPSRTDLSTVPPQFRDICEEHMYTPEELDERIISIQEDQCDRVFLYPNAHDIPSIGEMRNVAIMVGHRTFGLEGTDHTIFTRDDDDYTAPHLMVDIHQRLKEGASFAKPATSHIYSRPDNQWWNYDMRRQDDPALVIKGGERKELDRYIVWNDAAETQESEHGHLEMSGTFFSYRFSAWQGMDDVARVTKPKPGGFEPVSVREDHLFARGAFAMNGLDSVEVIDNDGADFVRLYGSNVSKVVVHDDKIDAGTVSAEAQAKVAFLACVGPMPAEYAAIDDMSADYAAGIITSGNLDTGDVAGFDDVYGHHASEGDQPDDGHDDHDDMVPVGA